MSNQLQTNLDLILEEKNTKLLPENLRAGVTLLGVTGTMQEGNGGGLDTSDATATANDIAQGKTAYVNGEKVEGTIELIDTYTKQMEGVDMDDAAQIYSLTAQNYGRRVIEDGGRVYMSVPYSVLANNIGLAAEKIVSGNTILGIEGTVTQGTDTSDATATSDDIIEGKTAYINGGKVIGTMEPSNCHWFSTIDEMNNSTNNRYGDKATVYNRVTNPIAPDAPLGKVIFPNEVVFDTPISSSYYPTFNNFGAIKANYINVSLNESELNISIGNIDDETGEEQALCNVHYYSEDGMMYTIDGASGDLVGYENNQYTADFQHCIEVSGDGVEYICEFMVTENITFGGLYQFDESIVDDTYIKLPYISSIVPNWNGSTFTVSYNGKRANREFNKAELINKITTAVNNFGYGNALRQVYLGLDKDDENKIYVFFVTVPEGSTNPSGISPYNLVYDENGFVNIATNDTSSSTTNTISLYDFNYDTGELTFIQTLTKQDYCVFGAKYYTLYDIPVKTIPLEIDVRQNRAAIGWQSFAAYKIGTTAKQGTNGYLSDHVTTLASKIGAYTPLPIE